MALELRLATSADVVGGMLIYRNNESSVDFQPSSPADLAKAAGTLGTTSLLLGSLQIEVGVQTGRLLFAWGLLPYQAWINATIPSPRKHPGHLYALNMELKAGISVALAGGIECVTIYDGDSGWVRHGTSSQLHEERLIEIAEGVVVGVRGSYLESVWLNPIFEKLV